MLALIVWQVPNLLNNAHNKRMQSDLTKRYALASAADAGRYGPSMRVIPFLIMLVIANMANATEGKGFTVKIGGPVLVLWQNADGSEDKKITDLEKIKSFDGKKYMDSESGGKSPVLLSWYIQDGKEGPFLVNAGVGGGVLRYEFMSDKNELWIFVDYTTTKKLSKEELQYLYEFTSGQWFDGAGPNFSAELSDLNNGMSPLS